MKKKDVFEINNEVKEAMKVLDRWNHNFFDSDIFIITDFSSYRKK